MITQCDCIYNPTFYNHHTYSGSRSQFRGWAWKHERFGLGASLVILLTYHMTARQESNTNFLLSATSHIHVPNIDV